MERDLKRSVSSDEVQPRYKKGAQTQNGTSVPNKMFEKRGGSHNDKPTCATCGKNHYGECLVGMGNYYFCGMSGQKKRYYLMMKAQGRENAQA